MSALETDQDQTAPVDATVPFVNVQNMDVAFGSQTVLRNICLQIPRGQTLAIIGESGCGKTVLLKTMIGLIGPTAGQVLFDGRDLTQLSDRLLAQQRARFGFVFQHAALFDSLSIGQNVAFPLHEHTQLGQDEIRETVMNRLAEVGLPDDVVVKKPAELSGGMRKRVGLARALVMDPEILLYDEPTTGLDPIMSDVINQLMIRTSGREDVTSVIVTHDMHSAMKVADRIVMTYPYARVPGDESQLIFDGTPDEIRRTKDTRVRQFVEGKAGERLMEMRNESVGR
jgi:phospholipid/cholesterol/gamma-HCH transport system ATP-binding protein